MKFIPILPLFAACLASSVPFAETLTLVDNTFESPTNLVLNYPPAKGEKFQPVAPGLSGWSVGGTLQLAYVNSVGVDGSGGMHAKITKECKFAQVNYSKLDLAAFRDDFKLGDVIRSVRLNFDANIPVGREFVVYMQVDIPKDLGLMESQWATRLVLGKAAGEGRYAHYSFSGGGENEAASVAFINYVRSLYLNGLTKLTGNLTFHLDPAQWTEGSEFTFDNVKLTYEAK